MSNFHTTRNPMYLLVWSTYNDVENRHVDDSVTDHWIADEDLETLDAKYQELITEADDLHSASICLPLVSTDYATLKPGFKFTQTNARMACRKLAPIVRNILGDGDADSLLDTARQLQQTESGTFD